MNVRTLCLGILNFEDATGYEIRKMSMDGKYSHFIDASYGSIYPALNKLEAEGLIDCREEVQPGKPARKVYSINDAGRRELVAALSEPPSPDTFRSEFLMIAVSAGMLPKEVVTRAIDTHLEHIRQDLAQIEQIKDKACDPNMSWAAGYGRHCMTQSIKYVEESRAVLEARAGSQLSHQNNPSQDKGGPVEEEQPVAAIAGGR